MLDRSLSPARFARAETRPVAGHVTRAFAYLDASRPWRRVLRRSPPARRANSYVALSIRRSIPQRLGQARDLLDLAVPLSRAVAAAISPITCPGHRVVYVSSTLRERGRDVRAFVAALEAWIVGGSTPSMWSAKSPRAWACGSSVGRPASCRGQIAAVVFKLRSGFVHGISLNVEPDLSHFSASCPAASRSTASQRSTSAAVTMD